MLCYFGLPASKVSSGEKYMAPKCDKRYQLINWTCVKVLCSTKLMIPLTCTMFNSDFFMANPRAGHPTPPSYAANTHAPLPTAGTSAWGS